MVACADRAGNINHEITPERRWRFEMFLPGSYVRPTEAGHRMLTLDFELLLLYLLFDFDSDDGEAPGLETPSPLLLEFFLLSFFFFKKFLMVASFYVVIIKRRV